MRATAQGVLAAVLAGVLGCSLLVDTSDLDSGCPEGTKLCPGEGCVDIDDEAYGCTRTSCAPCENLTNAVAVCSNLRCVGLCLEGWDCAGCLVNIFTDEDNCGRCCEDDPLCENKCDPDEICKEGSCTPKFE